MGGQLHASADLLLGKEAVLSIGWEAGWAPEPVWTTRRGEIFYFYWDSNSDPSAVQPVSIPAPISGPNESTYGKPEQVMFLETKRMSETNIEVQAEGERIS
jgi:hypothetical protein